MQDSEDKGDPIKAAIILKDQKSQTNWQLCK